MSTRSKALITAVIGLLFSSIVLAHSDGIYNPGSRGIGSFEGISNVNSSGGGGGSNFLLADTGSVLLVDVGSKFLVQ